MAALFVSVVFHACIGMVFAVLVRMSTLANHAVAVADVPETVYLGKKPDKKSESALNQVDKTPRQKTDLKESIHDQEQATQPSMLDADFMFYPPQEVDQLPMPRSAPDFDSLQGMPSSGFPIDLRIFIDGNGKVYRVVVLKAFDDDIPFANRIADVMLKTAFVPARHGKIDVSTYIDREFYFEPQP
ncbi:hypothetical protein [Andreprevotia chitinilytica]|uniref:hypothetical protein n=1 Tax=Andreprevotia chitinilytica TaxID=396808 RepID=UPI0012EC7152|nr:hypothetical protein [Andreprevotia chitinilytica]